MHLVVIMPSLCLIWKATVHAQKIKGQGIQWINWAGFNLILDETKAICNQDYLVIWNSVDFPCWKLR